MKEMGELGIYSPSPLLFLICYSMFKTGLDWTICMERLTIADFIIQRLGLHLSLGSLNASTRVPHTLVWQKLSIGILIGTNDQFFTLSWTVSSRFSKAKRSIRLVWPVVMHWIAFWFVAEANSSSFGCLHEVIWEIWIIYVLAFSLGK